MNPAALEKRREIRHPADGEVRVCFHNPAPAEILGQLMDVSENGFRMAHGDRSLETGQVVEFSHPEAAGRARVVWNRIDEACVETGFVIIAGPYLAG